MKIQLYAKDAAHHQHWIGHFAIGLDRHNQEYGVTAECGTLMPEDVDLHVFWSMKHPEIIRHCKKTGQPFLCLERGYIDRMNFTSVNLNGLNGRSDFIAGADYERVKKHRWGINPRYHDGKHHIIMGQVSGDSSLEGLDVYEWVKLKGIALRAEGIKPFFKPHPLERMSAGALDTGPFLSVAGVPIFMGDMKEALYLAKQIHTYSSNAAVDAWLAGVPCLSDSPVSMIFKHQMPDGRPFKEKEWLEDISYRQYNTQEFMTGQAWQIIRERIYAH